VEDKQVQLFTGANFKDHRGEIRFVNGFSFPDIKRFYQIIHPDTTTVRAWQGHKIESKYFYVAKGKVALAWVQIDNWEKPSFELKATIQVLDESAPSILYIPPGYANGIKALEPGSILIIYSNLTLEESSADRWSFDSSFWLDWETI
jgi:dTDP-4-dehydrorhamnose 3,5-epimerase-like enzyme